MGRQIRDDYKGGVVGAHSVLLGDTHGKKEWSFRVLEAPLAGKAESVPVLAQQGAGKRGWFEPGKVGIGPVFSGNSAWIRLFKVNRREGVIEVVFAGDS
jgi:hypothetical protein